jgi:carbon starvation protein
MMNSVPLLIASLVGFAIAYRIYGRIISKTFGVDPAKKTPAHEFNDGIDFVPAKSWWVLFGHHFSSICGAGPIVGPALAVAYWGWGVSLVWVLIGSILMGAVADFSSLMMSMRAKGQSIANVSGVEISPRVKIFFSVFLWISLILVIAVFSIFGAKTFIQESDAVLPSFGLIPLAMVTGFFLYRTKIPNWLCTVVSLGVLGVLLYAGQIYRIELSAWRGMDASTLWIIILLIYCFAASVLPVNWLLQPRDYLASYILFSVIAIGLVSIFTTAPAMEAETFTRFTPEAWPEAGPLWPMLFVTIACGAISGFHSLVSSGTTCKQIASEAHACRISYGGMLLEAVVAVMVIIAVGAGLSQADLNGALNSGGPIAAFSQGYGSLTAVFLGDYGKSFAILGLNAFILTTLDSAARITRYLTSEVFGVKNKYTATLIVVIASAVLALSGQWNVLWPAFGASNQLIAGIALLIAASWLMNRGKKHILVFAPAIFMLITTLGAFAYQFLQALNSRNWMMVFLTGVLILLSLMIFSETLVLIRRKRMGRTKVE